MQNRNSDDDIAITTRMICHWLMRMLCCVLPCGSGKAVNLFSTKITMHTRAPSHADIVEMRNSIRHEAGQSYDRERDYMTKKHLEAVHKSRLIVGSLASLDVKSALKLMKAPPGCAWLPVCVENVFDEGRYYQVRAKGALIAQRVERTNLLVLHNDALAREILSYPLKTANGVGLERYLKTHWVPPSSKPICMCRNGCGKKCPCRLAGHGCGTDCHPAYYKKYPSCKNYKGEMD